MELSELLRRIDNLIREGVVHQVHADGTVIVAFGTVLSDALDVLEKAGADKESSLPSVGEQVLCFFPGGDDSGYCLRGIASTKNKKPNGTSKTL